MKFKPEGLIGSVAIALLAFFASAFLNEYHPFRFNSDDLLNGLFFAALVVVFVQVRGRTKRPIRSLLYGCIGSLVLFRFVCWDELIHNSGEYDIHLALMFWFGVTLIALGGVVGLEWADRAGK
ncbi:MAG: hypothetical protein ACTHKR_04055 [Sphingomonas sp.]